MKVFFLIKLSFRLIFFRIFIYLSSYEDLINLLSGLERKEDNFIIQEAKPVEVIRLVKKISRALRLNHCLSESSAAFFFLKRAGHEPNIVIGVKKDGDKLISHSWIELNSMPVLEKKSIESFSKIDWIS